MTPAQLVDFIHDEAALLDDGRWNDWLALFHPDGRYWMPLEQGQDDPVLQPSLMYEDKFLLTVRIERLHGARTFSQKPPSRCHHLLQQPRILSMGTPDSVSPPVSPPVSPDGSAARAGVRAEGETGGVMQARTAFIYSEVRGDDSLQLSGWVQHDVVLADGEPKIMLKRVDLLQCEAPLGSIQLFV